MESGKYGSAPTHYGFEAARYDFVALLAVGGRWLRLVAACDMCVCVCVSECVCVCVCVCVCE